MIFIQNKIFDALCSGKNIWRELRSLGRIPQTRAREELHGFSPEELNSHLASVSVSSSECEDDLHAILSTASDKGFTFSKVNYPDVVLGVAHFSSHAKGEDGIPQSVIAKAFPVIGHYLVNIFNGSLSSGIFPESWKKAHLVPLEKKVFDRSIARRQLY